MEFSGTVLETGTDVSTVKEVNELKSRESTVCGAMRNVLTSFVPQRSFFPWPLSADTIGKQMESSKLGDEVSGFIKLFIINSQVWVPCKTSSHRVSNSYQPFPYHTPLLSKICSDWLGDWVAVLRELLFYLLNINCEDIARPAHVSRDVHFSFALWLIQELMDVRPCIWTYPWYCFPFREIESLVWVALTGWLKSVSLIRR